MFWNLGHFWAIFGEIMPRVTQFIKDVLFWAKNGKNTPNVAQNCFGLRSEVHFWDIPSKIGPELWRKIFWATGLF